MRKLPLFCLLLLGSLASGADRTEAIRQYLSAEFPAEIDHIAIEGETISVIGSSQAAEGVFLAKVPVWKDISDPARFVDPVPVEVKGTRFNVSLPRKGDLTSRWQLVQKSGDNYTPLSAMHYADEVPCRAPHLPPAEPKSKKGIGGWKAGRIPGELKELGISAVTVNVMLNPLIALQPAADTFPIQWNGRTYHARESALARLDETFREAEQNGVMVSAILLVGNPARNPDEITRLLGYPDATKDGHFAMPNLTSEEGASAYGAILNLMAERWSKPSSPHGRVHHWIMHNEVDAGWEWTNAGTKSAEEYMDLYQRSMRMMGVITRQYDPNSLPFISLTHHWAERGRKEWYGSKRLLELLARFGETEGNFPWGLAYHPYPQDLRNPRTWEDSQATSTFDTAKITPKNLEVLDAWMKTPAMLYHGKVRPVHLSENGFNSKDYSETALAEQAAGMALAWKKISSLSSIESWQYHNWIDNRHEGGLRIGLRRYPDDEQEPLGKKPIWHLYQALGTDRENEACAPYLKVIGLSSWDEVTRPMK